MDLTVVEALRAIFMLLILFGHLWRGWYYPAGGFAVTGFFCISYATLAMVSRPAAPARTFILKRGARLLPLYYAALAVHTATARLACGSWATLYAARADVSGPGAASLDWVLANAWTGRALSSTAGTLWMLQTIMWTFLAFPVILRAEHAREDDPSLLPPAAACYVLPLLLAGTVCTCTGACGLDAVIFARETPVAHLPLAMLATRVVVRVKRGWRPSAWLGCLTATCSAALAVAGLLPGVHEYKTYRAVELLAQPVLGVGCSLLVACHDSPYVAAVGRAPLVAAMARLAKYGLSVYVWQSTCLFLAFSCESGAWACELPPVRSRMRATPLALCLLAVVAYLSNTHVEGPSNSALKRYIEE